jgi:hypothetical protein
LTIIDFHVVAFLNGLHQVPVVVSNEGSSGFVIKDKHELVHVHDLPLDVDVSHAVANFVYSRTYFTLKRLRLLVKQTVVSAAELSPQYPHF